MIARYVKDYRAFTLFIIGVNKEGYLVNKKASHWTRGGSKI